MEYTAATITFFVIGVLQLIGMVSFIGVSLYSKYQSHEPVFTFIVDAGIRWILGGLLGLWLFFVLAGDGNVVGVTVFYAVLTTFVAICVSVVRGIAILMDEN